MTTKLEIIGPYTPEHEGPFCTREGTPVRLITKTEGAKGYPIVGIIDEDTAPDSWDEHGRFNSARKEVGALDLMNAREVPVAREFWVNEYTNSALVTHNSLKRAKEGAHGPDFIRTIHCREVMPGEGA